MKKNATLLGLVVIAGLLGGCSTATCGTNPRFWYAAHKEKLTPGNIYALNAGTYALIEKFDLRPIGNYGDLRIYCGIPGIKNSDCRHSDARTLDVAVFSADGSFTLTQTAGGEPTENMNALRAEVRALMTGVLGAGGFDERRGFECKSMLARGFGDPLSNRC
jgi:hypothetical protein